MQRELLSSVVTSLQYRFQGVESHQVLLAASRLEDPQEWPSDHQQLASYGNDHIITVTEHFADVLDCDREEKTSTRYHKAFNRINRKPGRTFLWMMIEEKTYATSSSWSSSWSSVHSICREGLQCHETYQAGLEEQTQCKHTDKAAIH